MFQAVFPLIIRSSNLYMQHRVFVKIFAVTASADDLELSPNSSTLAVTANKCDKYPMLHVQIWAPDDELAWMIWDSVPTHPR
jgi:hypothetical protein